MNNATGGFMEQAIEMIKSHNKQNPITLLVDTDTDGVMSAVVGVSILSDLGYKVKVYFPQSSTGYGFDESTIEDLKDEDLIITADVGTSAKDELEALINKGVKVIVTDHHIPETGRVPEGCPIINPMYGDTYKHMEDLCGAGVLFNLLADVYKELTGEEIPECYLIPVAIGTIGDMMPTNTTFNSKALEEFKESMKATYSLCAPDYKSKRIRTLVKNVAKLAELIRGATPEINSIVPYYISPCINSFRRLGYTPYIVLEFLLNERKDSNALMVTIEGVNDERKKYVKQKYSELKQKEPYIYIVDALPGTLGLLAQMVIKDTGEPCVVINENGIARFRSPMWFPFNERLSKLGFEVKGHEYAGGIVYTEELSEAISREVDKIPTTEKFENVLILADVGLPLYDVYAKDRIDTHYFYKDNVPSDEKVEGILAIKPSSSALCSRFGDGSHFQIITTAGIRVVSWSDTKRLGVNLEKAVNENPDGPVILYGKFYWDKFKTTTPAFNVTRVIR